MYYLLFIVFCLLVIIALYQSTTINGGIEDKYNPPLVVKKYSYGKKEFNVIRDDLLECGTKQRAVLDLLKDVKDTLIYTSSFNGYGPVVTAFAAQKLGLKCKLFICTKPFGNVHVDDIEKSNSVRKMRKFGAEIKFYDDWKQMIKDASKESGYWIPLGFYSKAFSDILSDKISRVANINPSKIWVVGGTGGLANALAKCFKNATICVVPVQLEGPSFEKLKNNLSKDVTLIKKHGTSISCPYDTIDGYDKLAWEAAVEFGSSGDYIWNVAS